MKLVTMTAITMLSGSIALAAGSDDHSHGGHGDGGHEGGHGDGGHMEMMAAGMPGSADKVDRTIDVVMRETDDGSMIFEPAAFDITQGETIRFNVVNQGELEHEFVIDTKEGNEKHKGMMAEMGMEHDDPNSVRLDPDQSDEVIWTFANAGTFEFACLIPGHYESGMYGPIEVAQTETQQSYTKGVVKKIKADSGKVTIIHEELVNLGMPAMTMVFRAEDDIVTQLSEGQEIEFVAERVNGKLTVTNLK